MTRSSTRPAVVSRKTGTMPASAGAASSATVAKPKATPEITANTSVRGFALRALTRRSTPMSTEPTIATTIAIQAIGSSRSPSTSATTTGTAELRSAMSGVMSEIGPAASAAGT